METVLEWSSNSISPTATCTVPSFGLRKCSVMMQCPVISLHCETLLSLLSFLEFPPFIMRVTFYPRHNKKIRKRAAGIPKNSHTRIHNQPFLGHVDIRLPRFLWLVCVAAPGRDVGAGCFPLCWWLALAGLGLAVAGDPGLSDVITSFIGGHRDRPRTPPRSSHTLAAPSAGRPSHSSFSAVARRSQRRPRTHIKTQTHKCRPLLFVLYP